MPSGAVRKSRPASGGVLHAALPVPGAVQALLHVPRADAAAPQLARPVRVGHGVDVADLLRPAHFADRGRLAEILDVDARPAAVWNAVLAPLAVPATRAFDNALHRGYL